MPRHRPVASDSASLLQLVPPSTPREEEDGGADLSANRLAERWLKSLSDKLPAMFADKRVEALQGLAGESAELLRAVWRIELATLTGEDKVRIHDGVLQVHRDYPLALARRRLRDGKTRTALYVAHEVAHVVQGISNKRHVAELRAAEGEEALLHLDLAADHAAAVVVSAVYGATLEEMKRKTLAMLEDFPAGLDHSPGATLRKSRRAVAIAADIAGRSLGLVEGDLTYAYVYWPRGGGRAPLMTRGSFDRCISTVVVGPGEASAFDAAAGSPSSTRPLIATLARLLGSRPEPCARSAPDDALTLAPPGWSVRR